jgi:cob(I)alamin adenosyltransferase
MVLLNKIYTRTGDAGMTALGTGERVPKHALRIEAYGSVDETNAAIGMARVHLAGRPADLDAVLARIQNDLFDLGADLCVPDAPQPGAKGAPRRERLRVSDAQVDRLEAEIDRMNARLEPLRSFVLPGGTPGAAALHVARTVCRRAERTMVALAREPAAKGAEPAGAPVGASVSGPALKYINRLSDLLFVAGRIANDLGKSDVLWVPGQNR